MAMACSCGRTVFEESRMHFQLQGHGTCAIFTQIQDPVLWSRQIAHCVPDWGANASVPQPDFNWLIVENLHDNTTHITAAPDDLKFGLYVVVDCKRLGIAHDDGVFDMIRRDCQTYHVTSKICGTHVDWVLIPVASQHHPPLEPVEQRDPHSLF